MTFTQLSCEEFVSILASKEPVPGGGGAAALMGAIGTALGNMVGSLTLGKKKYADVEEDIKALKEQATALQQRFIDLVAADAAVFEPLSKAYAIPKDDPNRPEIMEKILRQACSVPMDIMGACGEAIDLHEQFAAKGTAIAISDVGCGVVCCKAAMQAASLNVFINTKSMTDRIYAEKINDQAADLLDNYLVKADDIFGVVQARFF